MQQQLRVPVTRPQRLATQIHSFFPWFEDASAASLCVFIQAGYLQQQYQQYQKDKLWLSTHVEIPSRHTVPSRIEDRDYVSTGARRTLATSMCLYSEYMAPQSPSPQLWSCTALPAMPRKYDSQIRNSKSRFGPSKLQNNAATDDHRGDQQSSSSEEGQNKVTPAQTGTDVFVNEVQKFCMDSVSSILSLPQVQPSLHGRDFLSSQRTFDMPDLP